MQNNKLPFTPLWMVGLSLAVAGVVHAETIPFECDSENVRLETGPINATFDETIPEPTLDVSITIADAGTTTCFTVDEEEEGTFTATEIPLLNHEETYSVELRVSGADEDSFCPQHDCCAPSSVCEVGGEPDFEDLGAPAASETCFEVDGDCEDAPTATGFKKCCKPGYACCEGLQLLAKIRSEGGGELGSTAQLSYGRERAGDNTRCLATQTGVMFSDEETLTFDFTTADAFTTADDGLPNLAVEVILENGNLKTNASPGETFYYADPLDQYGAFSIEYAIGDELPSRCMLCEDGSEPDAETLKCDSGCSQSASPSVMALMILLGLFRWRKE